jgi:hypothetical protein
VPDAVAVCVQEDGDGRPTREGPRDEELRCRQVHRGNLPAYAADDTSKREEHMATKEDFTEEEWETLQKGVTGAGFWMTIADRGFFDTFKESSAMAKHLAEARKSSESTLVRDLGDTKGTGFGWRSSPEEIEGQTIAALQDAQAILETKAPDELPAYRAFVLDVAGSVGAAAEGGETAEAGTLEKIRAAVGG